MSQSLIVTGSIELQLDRLAEKVAQRVVELLDLAGAGNSTSEVYDRGDDPDLGAGRRQGARFGAVTDGPVEYDPS